VGDGSTKDDLSVRLCVNDSEPSFSKDRPVCVAPIVTFWMAGAGCMIGCEGMVAAAVTVPSSRPEKHSGLHSGRKTTIGVSGHACPSSGSHSCCAKSAGETKPAAKRTSKSDTTLATVGGSSSGLMKGCPLAVVRAAIAAKVRDSEFDAAPVLAHSILPAEKMLKRTSPLYTPVRLPNRGHTYLRCCVFLI